MNLTNVFIYVYVTVADDFVSFTGEHPWQPPLPEPSPLVRLVFMTCLSDLEIGIALHSNNGLISKMMTWS